MVLGSFNFGQSVRPSRVSVSLVPGLDADKKAHETVASFEWHGCAQQSLSDAVKLLASGIAVGGG